MTFVPLKFLAWGHYIECQVKVKECHHNRQEQVNEKFTSPGLLWGKHKNTFYALDGKEGPWL